MHDFRYFLTIVDDFSRFTLVIFIAYIENRFKTTIKAICINNGAEFSMNFFFLLKTLFTKSHV